MNRAHQHSADEAFGELVQRHLRMVYGAALRCTDWRSDIAADVAQEICLPPTGAIWHGHSQTEDLKKDRFEDPRFGAPQAMLSAIAKVRMLVRAA